MKAHTTFKTRIFRTLGSVLVPAAQLTIAHAQTPTALHESVPYQNHPFLSTPVSIEELQDGQATIWWMQCEPDTFLTMVADLRQRIATATSTPASIGEPCSLEFMDGKVYHDCDCSALRDSVIVLQGQLHAALTTPPPASSNSCTTVTHHGYEYSLVSIGEQCWFAENLRTQQYADGSTIPEITDGTAWATAEEGAQCIQGNDAELLDDYGRLYNFAAATDARGLCPSGWHVPSAADWNELVDGLGLEAGYQMKSSASDSPSWNGSNSSGFSGIPGGGRSNNGDFISLGTDGYWWSTSLDEGYAVYRRLYATGDDAPSHRFWLELGASVRCLQD